MNIPTDAGPIRRWLWGQDLRRVSLRTGLDRGLLYRIREGWVLPDGNAVRILNAARRPRTPEAGRRQAQRLVDAKECERCGRQSCLHRHHVDGDSMNNEIGNLQVLCARCHGQAHRHLRYLRRLAAEQTGTDLTPEDLVLGREPEA